jgi:membrane-associated protease RseP (regulator of RpoE activity)
VLEVIGIVLFAIVIGASIALHELGHLVPAKAFGVRVSEYMIGFGPTLWSKVKGETKYGLKAVPLGGYIRMIGMLPPAKGDAEGTARQMSTGRFAVMIADARRASVEEIEPGDENRLFYTLPVRKRITIMLGGPTMNLLLAFVLFAIMLVGIGLPQPTLTLSRVVPCTPSVEQPLATPLPSGQCPTGSLVGPAQAAGLMAGDTITALNGTAVSSWDSLTEWIRANGDQSATLTVDRNGQRQEFVVDIATVARPEYDANGIETGATTTSGFIGVSPGVEYVSAGWSSVPSYMWDITVASVKGLISLPIRLYELVKDTLIGGEERAIDGPVSVVGVTRIGGEVAAMDQPLVAKAATFLGLAASLNLFLFLFNLIPVLPLDGGHVAGALYEGSRRRLARLFGRSDPGPVDVARLMPVAYVVAGILLAMGVIVIWADIVRPISLG